MESLNISFVSVVFFLVCWPAECHHSPSLPSRHFTRLCKPQVPSGAMEVLAYSESSLIQLSVEITSTKVFLKELLKIN